MLIDGQPRSGEFLKEKNIFLQQPEKKMIPEAMAVLNKQGFETQLSGTISEHSLHGVKSPDKELHNGADMLRPFSGITGIRRVRHSAA